MCPRARDGVYTDCRISHLAGVAQTQACQGCILYEQASRMSPKSVVRTRVVNLLAARRGDGRWRSRAGGPIFGERPASRGGGPRGDYLRDGTRSWRWGMASSRNAQDAQDVQPVIPGPSDGTPYANGLPGWHLSMLSPMTFDCCLRRHGCHPVDTEIAHHIWGTEFTHTRIHTACNCTADLPVLQNNKSYS